MTISDLLGFPFGVASRLRQASVFHPSGVLFDAYLTRCAPIGVGLPVETSDISARLSKALGTPSGLADIGGVALRLPLSGEPRKSWDILLAGAAPTSIGRLVLWPTMSWNAVRFSSLMPLKYGDRMWWVRARITTPIKAGMSLAGVRDEVGGPGLTIELDQACGTGPFRPLAVVQTTGLATDGRLHLAFDPVLNSPESVRPQPEWLRRLRLSAYRYSRSGRPDTTVDA